MYSNITTFSCKRRYDASEVEGPTPQLSNNPAVDEVEYSVEKWKEVIWEEVKLWEAVDTSVPDPVVIDPTMDKNANASNPASQTAAMRDTKVGNKKS